MGFPIHSRNDQLFTNLAADADQTSSAIDIREAEGFSVQVDWSGGVGTTATIIVQGTNYNAADSGVVPVWATVTPNSGSGAVASNSGSALLNFELARYDFFRVLWDQSAGAGGTINAIVCVKSS